MKKSVLVVWATVVYAVIDIVWNILVIPMYVAIYNAAGSDRSFVRESLGDAGIPGLLGILMFFILIGWANVRFAIVPGVQAKSIKKAAGNAFLFGCAAYATYIAPQYLMITGTPAILIPLDTLIGGGLSAATSTIMTRIALKRGIA